MPISIDNTNYLNNEYVRYSSTDTSALKDGTVSVQGRENLPSGKTVTGEIIEKDGNQVTIKLSNDQTISAKLSGNADISVGMKMTFEVAARGDQVALRPLFSNLANNSAAMSALKAAGLPVNNTTLAMTDRMMTESMPVNRNALAEMFRNVSAHQNVSPESIVQMTKLNMPLTETNVIQFDNYRNFEHQITDDLTNVRDGITDLFKEALAVTENLSGGGVVRGAAGGEVQSFAGLSANEVISQVLDLIDTDSLETIMPSASDIENAAGMASSSETVGSFAAAEPKGDMAALQGQEGSGPAPEASPGIGQANPSAASIIRSTVDGLISDVRELFFPGSDEGADIPVNSNLSLSAAEQLSLSNEIMDIMVLAEKGPMIKEPLDPSEIMTAVKELVEEYPPGVEKIEEAAVNAYSEQTEEAADDGRMKNAARDDIAALKNGTVTDIPTDKAAADAARTGPELSGMDPGADKAALEAKLLSQTEDLPAVRQTITQKLTGLLKSEAFSKLLGDSLKAQMSIKPEDVSQNGKIEELYSRIQKTTSRISQLMENIARTDSPAAQSSAALMDNVNFMNQLNEFVNYVQLPLKMAGEDANGELYVYTNKKNLSNADGNYSALLHLDMEHLGPMDIYVTMRDHTKVSTNFYLQSEDLLDFMEDHIDMLTKRLAEKGYDTSMRVTKKEKGETIKPMADEFTKDEARADAPVMVSKMRFDVRA
ncbi:MAG: flagellar hook-length control protein FliK [Lachnospiraceae bacterium]|nr:flagellar hook-length control protein FliK [Lachnospiraceae bacterium]